MVSLEIIQATSKSIEPHSSPRISFSAEFLNESNFIAITPHSRDENVGETEREKSRNTEFEFLSSNVSNQSILTADELFCEGKLLPFWQMQYADKVNKISLDTIDVKEGKVDETDKDKDKDEGKRSWYVDDDPSPRPPTCNVLWKELLRLKKQRGSSFSPSSSCSSSSSTSSSLKVGVVSKEEGKDDGKNREKHVKRIKKGLERTRSGSIRIRPMVNVPICTQVKTSVLPPLFPLRKGKLER